MSEDASQIRAAMRRVREVCGEHFESFVFIGRIPDDDGEGATTISTWSGGFNEALGLSVRLNERMRQEIIKTDYPDEPTPGDDWRESKV